MWETSLFGTVWGVWHLPGLLPPDPDLPMMLVACLAWRSIFFVGAGGRASGFLDCWFWGEEVATCFLAAAGLASYFVGEFWSLVTVACLRLSLAFNH